MANITVCKSAVEWAAEKYKVPADMIYVLFSDQPILEKIALASVIEYWSRMEKNRFDYEVRNSNVFYIGEWLVTNAVINTQTEESFNEILAASNGPLGFTCANSQRILQKVQNANTLDDVYKFYRNGLGYLQDSSLRLKVFLEYEKKTVQLLTEKLNQAGDDYENVLEVYSYFLEHRIKTYNNFDMPVYFATCEKLDELSLKFINESKTLKQADESFNKSRKTVDLLIAYVKKLDEIMSKQ